MRYGRLLGWGIVIYAVMSLAWSGIIIYGLAGFATGRIIQLVVLIAVATIAARSLKLHSWKDILPYSFLWAAMMAGLDAMFNVPFAGWQMYADWNVWLGYALVAIVPLVVASHLRQAADWRDHE